MALWRPRGALVAEVRSIHASAPPGGRKSAVAAEARHRAARREDVGMLRRPRVLFRPPGALAKEVPSLTRTPTRPSENTGPPPLRFHPKRRERTARQFEELAEAENMVRVIAAADRRLPIWLP